MKIQELDMWGGGKRYIIGDGLRPQIVDAKWYEGDGNRIPYITKLQMDRLRRNLYGESTVGNDPFEEGGYLTLWDDKPDGLYIYGGN